jgi:hypothetical protein
MPKLPINYQNTLIYKIVCKDLNIIDLYVGHTTDFIKRKNKHKSCCNKNTELKIYLIINANGGWSNWDMIEVEKYPCNDNNEARARERYWFESLNANLNSFYPIRNHTEYYNDNIDKLKEQRKKYDEENKEKIKVYKKIYNDHYYQQKKEILKVNQKNYYNLNKDQISQIGKLTKYDCECGSCLRTSDKARHFQSKKHQDYLINSLKT